MIIRPRVFLVVALSVMIFTSTVSVLVSIRDAPSAFAADKGYVISSPGAPTVFSSIVDVGLLDYLSEGSPEIFALSSYDGVPFVVRGLDPKIMADMDSIRTDGKTGFERDQALIGADLRDRLSVDPPCSLSVTASYQSKFDIVDVVGWFKSSSSLDDELLVPLDLARSLSGMGHDKVSIVRLASVSSEVEDALMPSGARFAVYGFSSSRSKAVSGEEFELGVSLKNWGTERGKTTLEIHDDLAGNPDLIFSESIELDAGEEVRVVHSFSFDELGTKEFAVSIDGKDPQRLALVVEIVAKYLLVAGPADVALNSTFEVAVTDFAGGPVEGATVAFLNQTAVTNSSGIVRLSASELGTHLAVGSVLGFTNGSLVVEVYDVSIYPNEFKPIISGFEVVPIEFMETETGQVRLIVENGGRQAGIFTGTILLDYSTRFIEVGIPLGPGEGKTVYYPLERISPGHHTLSLNASETSFSVFSWYAGDPDLVMLAVKYGGTLKVTPADSIPIAQAAKLTQGDIEVALVSVGGISGVLAALSMTAIFSKEVHEARGKLGILRTIGAPRSAIRRMVVRQSLSFSSTGAVTGIALGLGVSGLLLNSGALMMFGHSLRFDVGMAVAPWILIGTLVICLASSVASAEVAVRATPISSIRKTEEAPPEQKTVDDVLGDE